MYNNSEYLNNLNFYNNNLNYHDINRSNEINKKLINIAIKDIEEDEENNIYITLLQK